MQRSCDSRECWWERSEEDDDHKYQPDVIRFPDGADCFGDQCTLLARTRSESKQIPDAATVISAAQQSVQDERSDHHTRDNRFKRQVAPPLRPAQELVGWQQPGA